MSARPQFSEDRDPRERAARPVHPLDRETLLTRRHAILGAVGAAALLVAAVVAWLVIG